MLLLIAAACIIATQSIGHATTIPTAFGK